jgi:hypothetical protein
MRYASSFEAELRESRGDEVGVEVGETEAQKLGIDTALSHSWLQCRLPIFLLLLLLILAPFSFWPSSQYFYFQIVDCDRSL